MANKEDTKNKPGKKSSEKSTLKKGEYEKRYSLLLPVMNEKQRRLLVASDVLTLNLKISQAAKLSGLDRNTIYKGIAEIESNEVASNRIRSVGGGRKKKVEEQK
jgi:transcriptional regulator of acetoin/glycerol metabolism